MGRNVLVTGASGGFGELTIRTLLRRGHRVIGSIREPQGKNRDLAQLAQITQGIYSNFGTDGMLKVRVH